ncbi:Casein kinase II regulatory subunit family protein [Trichomonas vaginalis G3]|uniref:Casein kinase II subunit beta n=1 Tax=Trichomonas vaginalis (strain ATCC PRA-98 / G3) TaxID=412133 RepID=A2EIP1_TRIV3|nr:protein kinase regulator protein [Trichomonas vaginalis G3]EAY07468.1 Casein kinase II regulatory subunit family protein [Trichomonas vaginalis G3]KAI5487836.1 protein kinase regulator protein [Trichomonas vaginalis G3]|eukprot:XP_001319691.1 Casein kinase II regulatory subunit family protein [Trichomonas vaginalis G3]
MFLFDGAITKPPKQKPVMTSINDESDMSSCEWINEFIAQSDWITYVDEAYLNDNFNLYGLNSIIEGYSEVVKFLRGQFYELPPGMTTKQLLKEAEKLYTLIHARFLLTYAGVKKVKKKYESGIFGQCPRVACNHHNLLPIGMTPSYGEEKVKVYCPCCHDIYNTNQQLDGALFGPYFPHFLLQGSHDKIQFAEVKQNPQTYLGISIEPKATFGGFQNLIFKDDDEDFVEK